jgi:hypothetical protein
MSNNLNQLQLQLAAIQEQQRLQTYMIKQFQEQLKTYEEKKQVFLPISSDEDDDSSPLDLSATSIKSDEDQSTSIIEFQMESHEGEPENPNMSKVCFLFVLKIF